MPTVAHSCLPKAVYERRADMILTCPACGTQYAVKDGAIPEGGRKVRCASCGHSWPQMPEEASAEDGETVAAPELAQGDSASPAAEFDTEHGDPEPDRVA